MSQLPDPLMTPRERGGAVLALLIVLVLAGGGAWPSLLSTSVRAQTPIPGATPVSVIASPEFVPAEPGVLLQAEPFTRDVPVGARAWRILYTTTRAEDETAVASGLVIAPDETTKPPYPVIAWTHGTTGVAEACAPSLLEAPFAASGLHMLDAILAQGWAVVATDYVGLGSPGPHPYLIGEGTARSALDAVRAARQLDDLALAEETAVWGHSQGGHAALWTGILAPTYAPEAEIVGVAALAPATDLRAQLESLQVSPFGTIITAFVVDAYSRIYPDIELAAIVRPEAREIVEQIAGLCVSGARDPDAVAIAGLLADLDGSILAPDAVSGPLGQRLEENTPRGRIPAPLLIGQGLDDDLVLPRATGEFVARRCDDGQPSQSRTYAGRGHGSLIEAGSPLIPDLIAWTQSRFAGEPGLSGCSTTAV